MILHRISQSFFHFDDLDFLHCFFSLALIKFKMWGPPEHAQHFKLHHRKEHFNAHFILTMRTSISDLNPTRDQLKLMLGHRWKNDPGGDDVQPMTRMRSD